MDINNRNDMLSKEFSEEQISDINRAIEGIPIYDLEIEVFTEGFEDILVDDDVSIKIRIVRSNLLAGSEVGISHSLGYTEIFEEKVAINLIGNKLILDNSIETIRERNTERTFHYRPSEPGKLKIICDMISLDFKGVNISKEFEINVVKNSEKRKEHMKDIEKRQVKKIEPSFLQQVISSMVSNANDDDEEEEEEEEDDKKKNKDNNKDDKEENKEENKEEDKEGDKEEDKEDNKEENNDEVHKKQE
jgi:hypothetical protein